MYIPHILSFTYYEQQLVNAAREFLKGKILVEKLSKKKVHQNGKLKFCIEHRETPEIFGDILAGKHQYEAEDKPGWENGQCVNAHIYAEYQRTCD